MTITIQIGRIYRAKRPANAGGFYNDRSVIHVGMFDVQYDGPAVGFGRHYPSISKEKFTAWAAEDVTDKLPPGEWQPWRS